MMDRVSDGKLSLRIIRIGKEIPKTNQKWRHYCHPQYR
jgi:hypothetical protein